MSGTSKLGYSTLALSVLLLGCSSGGGHGGGFASLAPTPSGTTATPVTALNTPTPAPAFQVGPTLQTPRGLHTATLLGDGRVLIVGGIDPSAAGATLVTESEIYDPTAGTFTNVSNPSLGGNPGGYMMIQDPKGNPFPVGRASHTATLLADGRVLISGGFGLESFDAQGNPVRTEMATAFTFSATTNTFTATQGKLNTARSEHSAVLLPTGQVLIAGGENSTLNNGQGGTLQSGELFDPTTGVFTALSASGLDLISPRQDLGAAATSAGALLVGGDGFVVSPGQTTPQPVIESGAETFQPSQGTFATSPGPAVSRSFASLTATSAGFVLAGGTGSNGLVPSVERLNAQLSAWAPIAQLQQARMHHAAAANDEGVLLAGGVTLDALNNLVTLASAEFLNGATNVSSIVSMTYARNGAAATTLRNGTILVTGGLEGGTKNVQGLDATSAIGPSELFTMPGASATATIAATTPTATAPAPASNLPTIRVAAGSKTDYTDSLGNDWSADNAFTGGVTASTGDAIVGTNDGALYQRERNGNMTYQFAAPNGAYAVTLKFAEFYWGSAGKRIFNVSINGALVLNAFDIFAAAGDKDVAIDKTFPVTVTNGQVQIVFTTIKDNAKISAILIGPPATASPTTTTRPTIRVAAGNASPYADSLGNVWSADTGFVGGTKGRTTDAVTGTADSQLYQNERNGNLEYGFALPNGNYTVTLKFAEIYWGSAGKRLFNVFLDGTQVLSNFDVFATAGGKDVAFDQSFPVTVANGQVLIQFTTIKDNAKISAIEIAPR
jgi:hypothetical protein